MSRFRVLFAAVLALSLSAHAASRPASRIQSAPVPEEMRSPAFTVKVDGQAVDVAHAAASLEFVSFDLPRTIARPVTVEITANEAGFWDKGVDIQPWRLGIRPTRQGQTIRFSLNGPAKLSISRPRDFLSHAKMLFLFAGTPPPAPPKGPNVTIVPAGIHRESLNPKSGDTIYLAPGAFVFGSLNLWKVDNVKVLGRGTIVYEGSQDPNNDEGWLQRPDWHCIGAMDAHHVQIDGLTCVVRARTWSIQMKDSTGFVYNDLRVMGGNPGNANQDGMDWLGGGDTTVRDSFLRASDDVFAMQGNWDGYLDADMLRPGKDVQNILIENSVVSTSISNIVRAGWPRKTYNSRNFTLRNSDVLHAGLGACGQTFGLLGFWGAENFKGDHQNYTFENLFVDNWYSLLQIERDRPSLKGFSFRNIWALDQPPLVGSSISGPVGSVLLDNVKYGQKRLEVNADVPLSVSNGAQPARFAPPNHGPVASFTVDPPVFGPGQTVTLTAAPAGNATYTWLFGDGTQARGRIVRHRFPDAEGTELDGGANGAGRFRVLLRVQDRTGRQDWAAQGLVAVARWFNDGRSQAPTVPGLQFGIYPGVWTQLPDLSTQRPIFGGEAAGLQADARGFTRYAVAWDGYIDIPADGGYTFAIKGRDGVRLAIDGVQVAKTGPPFAQVCGSIGNAMQYDQGSLGLRAGRHALHLESLHSMSGGAPVLLWEGPGLPLTEVPVAAYSHPRQVSIGSGRH